MACSNHTYLRSNSEYMYSYFETFGMTFTSVCILHKTSNTNTYFHCSMLFTSSIKNVVDLLRRLMSAEILVEVKH